MEQPVKYWVPSIAPSGMAFYTGKLFPKWNGSLFTGALAGKMLVRLSLNGNAVTAKERLLQNLQRAHPRRPPGAGRRAVAADRQFGRTDLAGGAGREMSRRPLSSSPAAAHPHLWKIKNAPAAMKPKPSA